MRKLFLVLVFALSPGILIAQETSAPATSFPRAKVQFGDSSVINMTFLQERIDVQTKYGKLSIPATEIRRVEFGLHLPPDVNEEITRSIKHLASGVYKEREAATKALIHAGHLAMPALRRASKNSDMEVAQRAGALIDRISERTAPELLKLREEDVVHTTEFTVVGKITAQTLRAHSAHFGEVALRLSELRTMHVRQQGRKSDLIVDASKDGSTLDQWCDTGVTLDAGQRIVVIAEGQVDLWPRGPGQYLAGPDGYNTAGKGGQFMAGALVGKIGENGKAFYVGERYDGAPNEEGRLFLLIVPSPWNSASSGNFRVAIVAD